MSEGWNIVVVVADTFRLPRYEHQGTNALGRPEFTEQQPQRTQHKGGTA